jgi:hypothetical protein
LCRKVRREVVDCMRLLMKLAREKVSEVNSCQCDCFPGSNIGVYNYNKTNMNLLNRTKLQDSIL